MSSYKVIQISKFEIILLSVFSVFLSFPWDFINNKEFFLLWMKILILHKVHSQQAFSFFKHVVLNGISTFKFFICLNIKPIQFFLTLLLETLRATVFKGSSLGSSVNPCPEQSTMTGRFCEFTEAMLWTTLQLHLYVKSKGHFSTNCKKETGMVVITVRSVIF